MDKTTVMIEFSIYGEKFDPEYITQKIGIIPTDTYLKGDLVRNGKVARKETSWEISTDYEFSMDINEQIGKVMSLIEDKEDKLIQLKNELSVNMLFMIVIKIENHDVPAMYFTKSFINFASRIDAEVGFDTYILS